MDSSFKSIIWRERKSWRTLIGGRVSIVYFFFSSDVEQTQPRLAIRSLCASKPIATYFKLKPRKEVAKRQTFFILESDLIVLAAEPRD